MNYLHLEKLAAHLASTGILCLRFTCRTRNFKYRIQCFTAVVVRVTFLFVVGDELIVTWYELCNVIYDTESRMSLLFT